MESGSRCWIATQKMHLANWSIYLQFINEPTFRMKAHLYEACERNTNPGAKPKSSDSKISSTNVHYVITCSECTFCRFFVLLYFQHLFGVSKVVPINVVLYWRSPNDMVATHTFSIAPVPSATY